MAHIKPPSDFIIPKVDVKDGEYLIIRNEAVYNLLPDKSKEVLTVKVETPAGAIKKMSINNTSQKKLIAAWGDDSKNWIGGKCSVEIVKTQAFGRMLDVIYLTPVEGSTVPEEEIQP